MIMVALSAVLFRTYFQTGWVVPFTGNVVDQHGFLDCCEAFSSAVWNNGVWFMLMLIGAAVAAYLLARVSRCIDFSWLRNKRPLPDKPAAIVYGSVSVLSAVTLIVPPTFFDRYYLPLVAGFILFFCRQASTTGMRREEAALRWALIVPVLFFSIAAQHDSMQVKKVRWEASQRLVSQGVDHNKIGMSFEWGGEYLFNQEGERIRDTGDFATVRYIPFDLIDPQYYIRDVPIEGYDVVRTEQYTSWLEFGQTRTVLVQKRR
jgi:hypothetical protein